MVLIKQSAHWESADGTVSMLEQSASWKKQNAGKDTTLEQSPSWNNQQAGPAKTERWKSLQAGTVGKLEESVSKASAQAADTPRL